MQKLKAWISAARLRTLPLSVSGIILASGVAWAEQLFDSHIFILAILTTLGLQILSNFANDYGDGVKGADNADRVGPMRAVQSGYITPKQMLQGIVITSIITLSLIVMLIYSAFGRQNFGYSLFFLLLGLLAIAAAIKYTMGKTAYGYHGWGDLFVFLFFGWVSVLGAYFLYGQTMTWTLLFPASAIGMLSAAVLNLNNMRDQHNDAQVGKRTLVVKMGSINARKYHFSLIFGSLLLLLSYAGICFRNPKQLLFLIAFVPLIWHIRKVSGIKEPRLLDPELKKVALATFLLAILFALGLVV